MYVFFTFMVQKSCYTIMSMESLTTKALSNMDVHSLKILRIRRSDRYSQTLPLLTATVSEGQIWDWLGFHERFFRFMPQKKGQTPTRAVKLLLEILTAHTKSLLDECGRPPKCSRIRPFVMRPRAVTGRLVVSVCLAWARHTHIHTHPLWPRWNTAAAPRDIITYRLKL